MLQEILMALTGNVGGVIIQIDNAYQIHPEVNFISEADKNLLHKILQLGYLYNHIQTFIEDNQSNHMNFIIEETLKQVVNEKGMEIEREEETENKIKFFVKSVILVFQRQLDIYFQDIVSIEQRYLNGEIISLTSFLSQFNKYFDIFEEILKVIPILNDNFNDVLDSFYERKINGQDDIRNLYEQLFNAMYNEFKEFLFKWILYGKVSKEFFVKKMIKSKSQKLNDWDNDFHLQYSLIPKTIIPIKVAKYITFIGKAMRIISREGMFSPNIKEISELLNKIDKYNCLRFNQSIQQIQKIVSEQFINMIIKKENILKEIDVINKIYLLKNGNFYQTFIEEAIEIISLPPQKHAEYEINNRAYQNALLRLSENPNDEPWNKIKFILKSKGFNYDNFQGFQNLQLIGEFEKKDSVLKLISLPNKRDMMIHSSVWNTIKHHIEKRFQCKFQIRFKSNSKFPKYQKINQDIKQTAYQCQFIMQSVHNIKTYKQNKDLYTLDAMGSYFAIKFGFIDNNEIQNKQNNSKASFIQISCKQNKDQIVLFEKFYDQKNLDFADQSIYDIKITYEDDEMKIFVNDSDEPNETPLEVVNIKLSQHFKMDIGRVFTCLQNASSSYKYDVLLFSWSLDCRDQYISSQTWNGLSPFYECDWPASIILNQTYLERFEQIFAFIFPLKISQFKLSKSYKKLIFYQKENGYNKVCVLFYKQRKFISHMIDCLLEYVYVDVISVIINDLKKGFEDIKDFEYLRKRIYLFLEKIYSQLFFQYPNMVQQIFYLIGIVNTFESYLDRVYDRSQTQSIADLQNIYNKTMKIIKKIIKFIDHLSISGLNQNYIKLLDRLNFNDYFNYELQDLDETQIILSKQLKNSLRDYCISNYKSSYIFFSFYSSSYSSFFYYI